MRGARPQEVPVGWEALWLAFNTGPTCLLCSPAQGAPETVLLRVSTRTLSQTVHTAPPHGTQAGRARTGTQVACQALCKPEERAFEKGSQGLPVKDPEDSQSSDRLPECRLRGVLHAVFPGDVVLLAVRCKILFHGSLSSPPIDR